MSTEEPSSESVGDQPDNTPPQHVGEDATAAAKFREQLAAKQATLEDDESEDDLWSGGYSPKAMVGTWAGLVIGSVIILIGSFMLESLSIGVALGIILLLWIFVGLLYGWRRLGVHYQLTTQRFIHQTGIVTRKTDRIEVIDIDDVSYSQGPVQRALGVGTITITGSDRTHPELAMIGIANVKDVAGLIDDVRRKERRRRSLHIESI